MTDKIKIGQEVIKKEAQALFLLSNSLETSFQDAVDLINNTAGKVVVTGMGKSGHIARKIASTLSSTGKSAMFVHPSEAAHGDLGMITTQNCVIAISNSGESEELFPILDYCKRYGIALIGMSKDNKSTLAQYSNVFLQLPNCEEACPLGLAPTTSTTMSLALGDALAVAVYKEEFDHHAFAEFHPGGKLGNKLMKVGHLMHTGEKIPLVEEPANTGEAILEMTRKTFGCVGIVKDNSLVGIITDGDLRRCINEVQVANSIEKIVNHNPKTIKSTVLATEALKYMNDNKISALFVVDDKAPIGIIHLHDCLRAGLDK